jgi:branched-chain amino acid transport system substrate-binding protein
MNKGKFFIMVLSAVMICGAGCSRDKPQTDPSMTIKIGAIYPLSGPDASAGEDLKSGIELASEIINGSFDLPMPLAGGQGLPRHGNARVQFLFRDSQSDPKQAADLVEKLVNEEHVNAVMGCYSSTVTATASERAEMMGVPFLNAASTSPTLTERGFKWFFRTTPDDAMFARNFFDFFSDLQKNENLHIPRRLVLVFENRLWGTNVARAERSLAAKHEYEIIDEVPYDYKQEEFSSELRQVESAMPAVILQASYDRDAIALVRGYKARDINPVAILGMNSGFSSPHFLATLGEDGEYIMSRDVWSLDADRGKPLVSEINKLFAKRFGRSLTGYSARTFTAAIVLADAINRAAAVDAVHIREALLATDIKGEELIMPWDGVKFDATTGQNILGKGIIVQVQQGSYRLVWPLDLATRPVVWPMPTWSRRERGTKHDPEP